MNVNEYGTVIYANVGSDISANTSLSLTLQPQVGEAKTITQGLTVGTVAVKDNSKTYQANEYIQYTTKDGDIDKAGQWRKQAKAIMTPTDIRVGNFTRFLVSE